MFIISCSGGSGIAQKNKQRTGSIIYNPVGQDSIGIDITICAFKKIISELTIEALDSSFKKTTDYYISFIRIVNTIEKQNWSKEYGDFRKLFYDKVFKNALTRLNASFYKGGAFFCQDYDLFIGGPRHGNSQYHINYNCG